ncbi:MAG: hypothetical protein Q7T03_03965 [Deltaproteobacteria bacterium]|nr:hypothetical protein [Deltaproteobacteria bacterium]
MEPLLPGNEITPKWNFGAEAAYHGRSAESSVLYPGPDFFVGNFSAKRNGPVFNLDTHFSLDRRATFLKFNPSWQISLNSPYQHLEIATNLEGSGRQYSFETGTNHIEEATGGKISASATHQIELDFGTLRTSLDYALAIFHFQQTDVNDRYEAGPVVVRTRPEISEEIKFGSAPQMKVRMGLAFNADSEMTEIWDVREIPTGMQYAMNDAVWNPAYFVGIDFSQAVANGLFYGGLDIGFEKGRSFSQLKDPDTPFTTAHTVTTNTLGAKLGYAIPKKMSVELAMERPNPFFAYQRTSLALHLYPAEPLYLLVGGSIYAAPERTAAGILSTGLGVLW